MNNNEMNLTGARTWADLKGLLMAAVAGAALALMLGVMAIAAMLLV